LSEKTPFKKKIILSEDGFNKLLTEEILSVSKTHFTPIHIAETATDWLCEDGDKNILDIGAGIGKFCIAGALHSNSHFTGIEIRPSLVKVAKFLLKAYDLPHVEIYEKNSVEVDFQKFDAFYLYNPYYENIAHTKRLNNELPLSEAYFRTYTKQTADKLDQLKIGTRVVTYHGDNHEIPVSYEKRRVSTDGLLKLWVKS
jgi:hypothetical protein